MDDTRKAWLERLRGPNLKAMARAGASMLLDSPPPPTELIPDGVLRDLIGFPPLPPDATWEDREKSDVRWVRVWIKIRNRVLEDTGRELRQAGDNFRLLSVEDTSTMAPERAMSGVVRELVRGKRVVTATIPHLKDAGDRQRATDAAVNLGNLLNLTRKKERPPVADAPEGSVLNPAKKAT